jgi:hypothetical protein
MPRTIHLVGTMSILVALALYIMLLIREIEFYNSHDHVCSLKIIFYKTMIVAAIAGFGLLLLSYVPPPENNIVILNTDVIGKRVGNDFVPCKESVTCLNELNKLCPCINIVVSSFLDKSTEEISTMMKRAGVKANIIGKTPNYGDRSENIALWICGSSRKCNSLLVIDNKSVYSNNSRFNFYLVDGKLDLQMLSSLVKEIKAGSSTTACIYPEKFKMKQIYFGERIRKCQMKKSLLGQ